MHIQILYIKQIIPGIVLLLGCNWLYAQNKPAVTAPPVINLVDKPAAYTNTTINYVRTWETSMPITDPAAVIAAGRTIGEVKQTTQYLDGLGRPLQTVARGITTAGKDLVAPVVYDAFGREQYKYMPYVSPGSDGKFKMTPFAEQAAYMSTQYPGQRVFYAENQFNGPLNSISKEMAAGDSWAGAERGSERQSLANITADNVQIWNVRDNDLRPQSSGAYADGELHKNITKDEQGNRAVTFTDKEGHMILKKTEVIPGAADGHDNWLCTYYIYDDQGKLRCVLPPKAVALIKSNWNTNFTTDIAKELCFFYRYDSRNRMVMKQLPGADSIEMVYDIRDRVVFVRDGNLKQKSPKQWMVNLYDVQNRPLMTALYNSAASRETLQAGMNVATMDTKSVSYNVPYIADLVVASHDNRNRYEARNSITFKDNFDSGIGAEFETFLDANGTQHTITIAANNPLPDLQQAELYPLTYTFYDGYTFPGVQSAFTADFSKPEKGNNFYEEPLVSTNNVPYGMVTGQKIRILGTNDWLTTTIYYNNKGRVVQTLKDNATGGKDILTNLYDFNGKLLSSYQRHQNPRSNATPETTVLTMTNYDTKGRVSNVIKRLKDNTGLQRTIVEKAYNELGQLKQKRLGVNGSNAIETQIYDYNVRGWLRGVNREYVNTNTSTNWFGQELNYDSGFVVNQYNGNIAGTKWKSKTNNIARAYGFTYDRVNQLKVADFSQQNTVGALWTNTTTDFTVSSIIYDENGNIGHMNQQGMDGTGIIPLDNLSYTYKPNSNKLISVTDGSPVMTKLGDFKNGTNTGNDYDYDPNGNLKFDNNKDIDAIGYNHLNLPETITIRNKGSVKYLYDATGEKLRKTVTDNTVTPAKVTVTDYAGGFVYQNDSLQFLAHEEGRIRVVYETRKAPDYKYDYFLKDHLGNVRLVLTEQSDFTMYAASMETAASQKENALFSNIDNTRSPKPVGYPVDQTTAQNEFVAKLNATEGGKKIGPSLVLKVMAGDTVRIGAKAMYKSNGPQQSGQSTPVNDILASLIQTFNGGTNGVDLHTSGPITGNSPFAGNFTGSDYQRIQQKDPNQQKADKPKAYLNFVLFDEQFNLVDENSGVKQVQGDPDQLQTLAKDNMIIQKSGFLYVYTSNESQQDVFFDNVTVAQISGPVLEETHYYPFGLTMAGISSNALKGTIYAENKVKYNGKELQNKEFGDGSGLELYDYGARMYDPQIGRWHKTDNKAELYFATSPYVYALNQPSQAIDPDGNLVIFVNGNHFGNSRRGYWTQPGDKTVWIKPNGNAPSGYSVIGKDRINGGTWYRNDRMFDEEVMDQLGDHNSKYYDGSLGGWHPLSTVFNVGSGANVRELFGYGKGQHEAEEIIASLARDKNGNIIETIKIITHSMGGAYAKGLVRALKEYIKQNNLQQQVKITLVADFDPFGGSDMKVDPDIQTIQFVHKNNANVSGMGWLANENENGADKIYTNTGTSTAHTIFSFFNDISKLEEGTYLWDGNKWAKQL